MTLESYMSTPLEPVQWKRKQIHSAVQCGDVLFGRLAYPLAPAVELGSFQDDVASNVEKLVELLHHRLVLLSILRGYLGGSQDVPS